MVEDCAQLLDSIPDIESLFERKTKDQVQAILDEYLSTDASSETASNETQKYNTTSTSKVDRAFQELMGA
tara:strand:+ start:84 stop:293 length:210 start_codon:yes stop_codon:yes gene_type:complete